MGRSNTNQACMPLSGYEHHGQHVMLVVQQTHVRQMWGVCSSVLQPCCSLLLNSLTP
jgi:hypothetical protein